MLVGFLCSSEVVNVNRSVADGLYGAEVYSAGCCGLFALLAVIQLAVASHMLFVLAPVCALSSRFSLAINDFLLVKRWHLRVLLSGLCPSLLLLSSD